ncbi:uncharacterized protein CDAR_263071 [Caerostris darwini]|uniref:Uncharacterized protein n=1 Tax=Caerostris darwini TaxID=1538125 RepID=A0AAV4RWX1_9ARAC|nr:uncharacterized protein CDAR_263071 [Caerostris darwini]
MHQQKIRNKGLPPPKVAESLKKNKGQRRKCLPKQEKPQIEAQDKPVHVPGKKLNFKKKKQLSSIGNVALFSPRSNANVSSRRNRRIVWKKRTASKNSGGQSLKGNIWEEVIIPVKCKVNDEENAYSHHPSDCLQTSSLHFLLTLRT